MNHPERRDDTREPDPRSPVSEHTVSKAQPETVPDEGAGGPPRKEKLVVTPDEMARRTLEEATEAPAKD